MNLESESTSGSNASTIVGTVGGFQARNESGLQPNTSKIIWTFRIERFDAEGNRLPPVPVQMSARKFDGFVTDGDRVRVDVGSWKPGKLLKPKSFYNETTQSVVRNKDCFVATAAFGDSDATYVEDLRIFRDDRLQKHAAGRHFISVYYLSSPFLARIIGRSEFARRVTRLLLTVLSETVLHYRDHRLRRND